MAIKKALESLEGDLAGIYLPLNKMSAEQQKSLIIDNNLFIFICPLTQVSTGTMLIR